MVKILQCWQLVTKMRIQARERMKRVENYERLKWKLLRNAKPWNKRN